jgi:hypothetical protein
MEPRAISERGATSGERRVAFDATHGEGGARRRTALLDTARYVPADQGQRPARCPAAGFSGRIRQGAFSVATFAVEFLGP